MTVEELLDRISARELDDWRDYFEADAEERRLIASKVKPDVASDMVWMGPEERAEAEAAREEDDTDDGSTS